MTAPMFAEGRCNFDEREGGNLVIVTFENGASIVMSRHTMFSAARAMFNKSCEAFEAQPADVIRLHVKRG